MTENLNNKAVVFQTSALDMEKSAGMVEAQSELRQLEASEAPNYLHGKKLHLLTAGYVLLIRLYYSTRFDDKNRLCLSIFLVNFEISIVSTSLISITDDLKQFGRSSWVITGYLLTYTGTFST